METHSSVLSAHQGRDNDDVEGGNNLDEYVYVGREDDNDTDMEESDVQSDITEESDPPCEVDFHGLADIWKEMNAGLESTRDIGPSTNEHVSKDAEECDHYFILEEDIGYFCRVCGIIQMSIESVIDFQIPKVNEGVDENTSTLVSARIVD